MSVQIANIYKLTPMQEGMFFHSVLHPESGAYYERVLLTLEGRIDETVMGESFRLLIERHEALRTVFLLEETEQPLQVVLEKRDASITFVDVSNRTVEEQHRAVAEHMEADEKRGFDLGKDLLMRFALFKWNETSYQAAWSFHHIIIDGWSLGILARELFQIYSLLSRAVPVILPDTYPYSDYFTWLERQEGEGMEYWEEALRGYESQAAIPTTAFQSKGDEYKYSRYAFSFDEETTLELERLASSRRTTMNAVFQAIWGIVLQRYNGTNDVVFGSVVSGRVPEIRGVENMVGLFINTVPTRITTSPGQSFAGLLDQVHNSVLHSNRFSYLPLADVQSATALKQDLIHHIVAFENYPLDEEVPGADGTIKVVESSVTEHTNYPFEVVVFPSRELEVMFRFNGLLYEREMFIRLEKQIRNAIRQVLHNPYMEVCDIDIVTDDEREKLLRESGDAAEAAYPTDKTIHKLFEEQAAKTPDRTAVVCEEESYTYEELNCRANRLARTLREKGIRAGEPVGVLSDRSLEMVAALLAVLKAGGAYVPVDPAYPKERVQYTLDASGCRFVLAQERYLNVPEEMQERINLNDPNVYAEDGGNLEHVCGPEDLAYMIFTSGSTGKPKGVMIEHRNVVQLLKHEGLPYAFDERDVWTMFHSYCFDFSVWEMYGALLNGGKLVVVPKETAQDTRAFVELVQRHGVTVLNQTPTAFYPFSREALTKKIGHAIRYVIFGGEALNPMMLKEWKAAYPSTRLVNMYGITETTVHVTYKEIEAIDTDADVSNIGRPLSTLRSYVLDGEGRLQPIGVAGELYIAGAGLARGYVNNPALTAERFIDNPFVPGERMYRTGDLAKRLPDGNLAYLGRIDHQVKIRGYRIELGEIEKRLVEYDRIREAFVMTRTDRGQTPYLCAYCISDERLDVQAIREHLGAFLPDYMVPAHFVLLDRLPLNANGKVDRKALPEPEAAAASYEAPEHPVEAKLAEIWAEVLGVKRAGRADHFFELGGHSLKAMTLVSRIGKELQASLPLRDVFRFPTLRAMADRIRASKRAGAYASIPSAPSAEGYPLTSAQRRLFIIDQMEGPSTAYNMPFVLRLEGEIDGDRLERTFQALVNRHEAFRTVFAMAGEQPVQRVLPEAAFRLERLALREDSELAAVAERFVAPFDLGQAPLLRAGLAAAGERKAYLLVDMHHMVSDGTSMGVLVDEFMQAYRGEALAEQRIQYKDYAVWQNGEAWKAAFRDQEQYWLKQFEGEIPVLSLPTDYVRPQVQRFDGGCVTKRLNAALSEKLHRRAGEAGATLYMTLLAAYCVLLSKYSGQEDIVVGTAVAGRPHADLERMIGMFVGTLALRNYPQGEKTFRQFLEEVRTNALEAFENESYPYEELVEKLNLERDMSRNPLFDTMFVVQNMATRELELEGLSVRQEPVGAGAAKFDLTITAEEAAEGITLAIEYATALFSRETIERMAAHYVRILEAAAEEPEAQLSEIDMMTAEERRTIVERFNDTAREYPSERTIHQLFEEQAARRGDQPGLAGQLTYREVNEKANALAMKLRERGIGADRIVAVMDERSVEMVIAMLAVLKAGGAYLPMDPEYPADRIGYMLQDSGTELLLTKAEHAEAVRGITGLSIEILELEPAARMERLAHNPPNTNVATDLAYMMYTSGSTGKPKGVMVEHRGVVRLASCADEIVYAAGDRILQTGAPIFDACAFEVWGALLNGLELYIADKYTLLDLERLEQVIRGNGITAMQMTTPLFHQIVTDRPQVFNGLKRLMVGGDVVSPKRVAEVKTVCPELTIVNAYGPTENTVISTIFSIRADEEPPAAVPIGRPISNSTAYIVDRYGKLLPIGVPGELWVGGDGVARGYRNLNELTAEKFIPDPFAEGERVYRTGDMARWLPDGNIEFMGRMDFQLKIRGFRIELGEIEQAILEHQGVKETVVVAYEDSSGHKRLCAYVGTDAELAGSELGERLKLRLPNYMIPSGFIFMDKLPLNRNGKIDKKALPEPVSAQETDNEIISPANEIEQLLFDLWKDVLGQDRFGMTHNFFELGGDSIKAIQVISRLNTFGYSLPVKELLMNPEIRILARLVEKRTKEIDQGIVQGLTGLSPVQRWFFENRFTDMHHWNQAVMLYRRERFDESVIRRAFQKLVEHHDALRSVFHKTEPEVKAFIGESRGDGFEMMTLDVSDTSGAAVKIDEAVRNIHETYDLERGPLIRVGLFQTHDGDHLMIAVHHLVVDGVSWRILLEDFMTSYLQIMRGEPIQLPAKTHSYRDWVSGLEELARRNDWSKELAFWNGMPGDTASLPKSGVITNRKVSECAARKVELSTETTSDLLTKANAAYGTEINDLLLSALGLAVDDWTKNGSRVLIQVEGHGREEIVPNLTVNRTVGWFTSIYPVALDMSHAEDMAYQIKLAKETLRQIPNKGVNYGVLRYMTGGDMLNACTKPEIGFNYLGQFDTDIVTELFEASPLSSGLAVSPNSEQTLPLEIAGLVENGRLTFTISYHTGEFSNESIDCFAELLKKRLLEITEHCTAKQIRELTPSDVGAAGLSLEEFDAITRYYGL